MSGVLSRILETKRAEVAKLRAGWESGSTSRSVPRDVLPALERPAGAPLRLLAEIKFESPSAGALSRSLDAGGRAIAYANGGASMVSVLTDAPHFGGSWDDLRRARLALDGVRRDVPLLAKEFVLDEIQLTVARASGADAVLLIARIVTPERLGELVDAARQRELEPLVEVATDEELTAALTTKARVIGVNARDLDTLAMDPRRAARLLAAIPAGKVAVHLSGVRTSDDVRLLAAGRADAALVGEALMREEDPTPLLGRLVAAAAIGPSPRAG